MCVCVRVCVCLLLIRACVRVYTRVLVPPNLYIIHTYIVIGIGIGE